MVTIDKIAIDKKANDKRDIDRRARNKRVGGKATDKGDIDKKVKDKRDVDKRMRQNGTNKNTMVKTVLRPTPVPLMRCLDLLEIIWKTKCLCVTKIIFPKNYLYLLCHVPLGHLSFLPSVCTHPYTPTHARTHTRTRAPIYSHMVGENKLWNISFPTVEMALEPHIWW